MKYIVNKTVNIDKNEITSIKAVENDMKTRFINFQLLANNQPLDLTGLTVRVYGKNSKGIEIFNYLNIINSKMGLVELELTRPFLVAGITEYQLKIYTSDNGVLSSNILQIDVTKDLMSNNSVKASNEYTALEKMIDTIDSSVNKIDKAIEESKNGFVTVSEIGPNDDFNNITRMGCHKVKDITSSTPNSPLAFNDGIYNEGILNVYSLNIENEQLILQIYYPWTEGNIGHRVPVMRMCDIGIWTSWTFIALPPTELQKFNNMTDKMAQRIDGVKNDINTNTQQIASNSLSINDLYNWVNRNIQMEYISGATSLTLQPNKAYYLDGQHVADITYIDHSALKDGEKVYFYVASGDQLAHIVFRREGLCNQNVRVWLPKGQDFWIVGNTDGDKIFTMMKIGDTMRFLN